MTNIRVTINHDQDVECPTEYDGWKLYSFCTKHNNYKNPNIILSANIGLKRKLTVGTAFVLSYYEHSGSIWSLKGEGPQCQFDTVPLAGILIWEETPKNLGAKTYIERQNDARNFLKVYNAWMNGECYGYLIEREGEVIDSCGGFIGVEHIKEALKNEHPEIFVDEAEITGDASYILS